MARKKRKSRNKRNHKPIKLRNPLAELALMRQRSGGGAHKDKRLKRKNRNSWKKDVDLY